MDEPRRETSEDTKTRGTVFISCGQYSEEERALGRKVAELVEEITPFKGYFAQNQSDLDGLTHHIFRALYNSVGFIAIMHHRGEVRTPDGEIKRASVWIEQEIAIAAFIRQVLARPLQAQTYLQRGISREGVRQTLMLNPVTFETNAEVVAHLGDVLLTWKDLSTRKDIDVRLDSALLSSDSGIRIYRLRVVLTNRSNHIWSSYGAELLFPRNLVRVGAGLHAREVPGKGSDLHRCFRQFVKKMLTPNESTDVLTVSYNLTEQTTDADLTQSIYATAFVNDTNKEVQKTVGEVTATAKEV